MPLSRRDLMRLAAGGIGATVLSPLSVRSVARADTDTVSDGPREPALPLARPEDWDPIAFNRARGAAGRIPADYMLSINGPDGDRDHLGKHLPYIPALTTDEGSDALSGHLPLMWGDPDKGHAKHPNAARSEENPEGHWYNWIRLLHVDTGAELESTFADWPGEGAGYAVFGGGELEAEGGRNTIYVVALPQGAQSGDWLRVHAHCLTHGEYVDFVQVP